MTLAPDQIAARLDALQSTVDALVRKSAEDVSEGGVLFNHGRELGLLGDKLAEIEEEVSRDRLYAVNREREEHKADWKRTYSAVRGGMEAAPSLRFSSIDSAHEYCVKAADRAHGPLGSKAIDVDKRLTELVDVAALVKAAIRIEAAFEASEVDWGGEAARAIHELSIASQSLERESKTAAPGAWSSDERANNAHARGFLDGAHSMQDRVAALVKAAQDANAAYLAFEVVRGGHQDDESRALRLAMNALRPALERFEVSNG